MLKEKENVSAILVELDMSHDIRRWEYVVWPIHDHVMYTTYFSERRRECSCKKYQSGGKKLMRYYSLLWELFMEVQCGFDNLVVIVFA